MRSPKPIRWLLQRGAVVIAAGGGGIRVARWADGRSLHGVDAAIDKDLCSGLLARGLEADCLVIANDVAGGSTSTGGLPCQRALRKVNPQALASHAFPAGSKARRSRPPAGSSWPTGRRAVIGSLDQIEDMLAGRAGTEVCTGVAGGADTL